MDESHKPHRAPHSGAKAEKKKAKMKGASNKKGNNPKAFSMASGRKAAKIARRSTEVDFSTSVEICLHVALDVGEETTCSNGRSYPRGTSASCRCCCWTSRSNTSSSILLTE